MQRFDDLRAMLYCWAILSVAVSWSYGADPPPPATDPAVAEQLAAIARVGQLGAGSSEARVARDALALRGAEILPALFMAMDTKNVVAANWYRTVYEEIVERPASAEAIKKQQAFLVEYAADARRAGRPRRLALALIERSEPGFTQKWIAERLGDPEFGYEAVAHALTTGEQALREKHNEQALSEFRKAFDFARDGVQVSQAAAKLKTLGETVDTIKHLGLVVNWWLVGPFEAPQKTGFALVFEPEQKVDLAASYMGKAGKTIGWLPHHSSDKLGQLNLIDAIATTREAVAYAYAEVDLPQAMKAQVRCGADDNCTVWLNGEKIFGRDQWQNGTRFDRFITPINLLAGRNTLLVKICQGPQSRDPESPNPWSLQLRLCDEQGRGIAFRPLSPEPGTKPAQ